MLAILAVNGLHWIILKIAKKRDWKKLQGFIEEKPYGWRLTTGVLVALLIFLSIKLPLYDSYSAGVDAGKAQKSFTAIVSESNKKQVLVYQYGDTGLFKVYDTRAQSFANSYEVRSLLDAKLQVSKIIAE